MKKGFTLVELIGVMVIVGLITLVGVPTMTRTLKKTNEDEEKRVLIDFYLAAENYIESSRDNFPTLKDAGGVTYISLNELKNAGYIRANIVNPQTDEVFDYTTAVRVYRNEDGTLDYEYSSDYYGVDSYIRDDSLIVHFDALNNQGIGKFDENTDTWKDLSGNNNDGTNSGATFRGKSVYYDGEDDYTSIDSLEGYEFTNGQTLEINVKFGASGETNLLSNELGSLGSSSSFELTYINKINNVSNTVKSSNIQDKTYYTVTGTYDGVQLTLYVNGESVNNTTVSGAINISPSPYVIGYYNSTAPELDVYSVRIYNRALTADEVKHNYEVDKVRFNME